MAPRKRALVGLLMLGGMSMHAHARAQSPAEQMLAQSLFEEGRLLMAAKRYSEACPKLVESQRLDPAGGTLLNVAICHELEGRLGTAFLEMNAALAQARKDGRQDRADVASTHLASIAERVPRLTIRVSPPQDEEGLEVFLDGTVIRRPAWNVATIVDPGAHVVDARAPSASTPFRMTVDIREREQRTVEVVFARGPASAPLSMGVPEAPSATPPPLRRNPAQLAALIVGLGGLVVAGNAGLGWLWSAYERGKECIEERGYCSAAGLAAADRERTFGWVALIAGGIGIGGLVTALILPKRVAATASPTRGGAALSLTATF